MSTFLEVAEYPNATLAVGSPSNTVVGASTMDAALSDGSDSSYVQLAAQAELPGQLVQVSITPPVLPPTCRVFSVDVEIQILSVPEDTNQPLLLMWLGTQAGTVTVAGQKPQLSTTDFSQVAPTDSRGGNWTSLDLGGFTAAPDNTPWDPTPTTGNLASLSFQLGRGDTYAAPLRVCGAVFTVNYQTQASLTVIAPTSPSSDTQPTVIWLYQSDNFAPQQAYRVAVYTLAQTLDPNFDPFVSPAQFITGGRGSSADTSWWLQGQNSQWTLPGDLTDGTYVAYVQAISQWAGAGGDFTTPIESITWTRTAAPAGPPNTAVLGSAAYSYANMQTELLLEPGSGGGATTVAFTVQKCTDGVTWAAASPSLTYIRANGLTPVPVGDRYPLLNVPTQYRVIAYSGSPLVAAAAPSTPLTVTPADNRYILHHPTNPQLDTEIKIKSPKSADDGIKITLREMQGTYFFTGGPQNQALPGMTWGPTYGWELNLSLWFNMTDALTSGLWAAVEQLRQARCPLYFQMPTGEGIWIGMGPGAASQDVEDDFNPVPGNTKVYQWKRRKVIFTQINPPVVY